MADPNSYSFCMDLGDLHDQEVKEARERDAALDTIVALILKHGLSLNDITAALPQSEPECTSTE